MKRQVLGFGPFRVGIVSGDSLYRFITKHYRDHIVFGESDFDIHIHIKNIRITKFYNYYRLTSGQPIVLRSKQVYLKYDLARKSGNVRIYSDKIEIAWSLVNYLVFFILAMTREELCILHASAVIYREKAYVFSGSPGSGKTTIAGLSPGDILSDEQAILYIEESKVSVASLERWPRQIKHKQSYPLAGLYFIEQAEENAISGLDEKDSVSSVFINNLLLLFLGYPRRMQKQSWKYILSKLFNSSKIISSQIDAKKLKFRKSAEIWDDILR